MLALLRGDGVFKTTGSVKCNGSFPNSRQEVRNEEIESLSCPSVTLTGANATVTVCTLSTHFGPWSLLCIYVCVTVCVCGHVLSRRWGHELKRRLMSQDMKAQTPICSLPHSGGRLSAKNPILSANTHTYVYATETHREGQGLGTACSSGTERAWRRKKERESKQREVCPTGWQRHHLPPCRPPPRQNTSPWPRDLPSVGKRKEKEKKAGRWNRERDKNARRRMEDYESKSVSSNFEQKKPLNL